MARRGFDQGDLVMATLRHFRPRIVSEEGSSCGAVVVVDTVLLVEVVEVKRNPLGLSPLPLGLLDLPALPRGLLLGLPAQALGLLRHASCRW